MGKSSSKAKDEAIDDVERRKHQTESMIVKVMIKENVNDELIAAVVMLIASVPRDGRID